MERVVFTNGCFDIIHPGHISLLSRARALGDKLIVGLNSDRSIKSIKGDSRPIMSETDRAQVLLGLESVDEVIVFDELTPENIIRQIKPDILVKGGDWRMDEIIGSEYVVQNGGEVVSLPLVEGFSSSNYINRRSAQSLNADSELLSDDEKGNIVETGVSEDAVDSALQQHQNVFVKMAADTTALRKCADLIIETFAAGKKILICGNGGSAADAQHLAAEFVGRYETERRALPAIALTTDTSALTALANDYDFEKIFTRQVEALAAEGDCLIAISTSGNSRNVISAVMKARSLNCKIIGMTGENGKKLASLCDECLMIPSDRTARIQEGHITAAHIWCEIIDRYIANQ